VGARFSAPVQTGPGAHPASCTMGIGSFPGVETAGAWGLPLTPSSAEVLERVELYLYPPSGQNLAYKKGETYLPAKILYFYLKLTSLLMFIGPCIILIVE